MELIIGNKNYSSWSLRPWLLLHVNGISFTEIQESLNQDNIRNRLGKYSESCKVPVLIDRDVTVWDSLSICEYISECYLNGDGWPEPSVYRAHARSICSEMHSGFNALRNELPMNCRLFKKVELSPAAELDIQRIESIWSKFASTDQSGELRLFGRFNISDCFFAPVALRFKTYDIKLSGKAAEYQASILNHSAVESWASMAVQESEVVLENEIQI